nr:TlpA disulfide reductase family protein [Rhodococcus sp. HNM0569]
MWPRSDAGDAGDTHADRFTGSTATPSGPVDESALADARERAALAPCPAPSGAPVADSPFAGVTLTCLGDGAPVDLAEALAGKPALVNLWAYWCAPCAEELPYLQQFSAEAGDAVTVLTVHTDTNEANALARLADYGVTLPGVQDGSARVQAAVGAPAVLPVSVLVRADGTVASVLPKPFDSVAEIRDAVRDGLGVVA